MAEPEPKRDDSTGGSPRKDSPQKDSLLLLVAGLAVLGILACGLLYYPPVFSRSEALVAGTAPFIEVAAGEAVAETVNINTASWQELSVLPGIGEVKARAIVDYREREGAFAHKDDILKVHGIGPATWDDIEDLISV
jgi:competence protein ComEA